MCDLSILLPIKIMPVIMPLTKACVSIIVISQWPYLPNHFDRIYCQSEGYWLYSGSGSVPSHILKLSKKRTSMWIYYFIATVVVLNSYQCRLIRYGTLNMGRLWSWRNVSWYLRQTITSRNFSLVIIALLNYSCQYWSMQCFYLQSDIAALFDAVVS
jgi:hypothetical protein